MSKERIGSIKDHTPNFKMIIPRFDLATWHDYIEENFRNIDALFFNLFGINNYSGSWKQITEYKQDQVLFIGNDLDINGNISEFSGRLVKVLKDHVTDNSDYFNIFYNLHPDYYELFADAPTAQIYANLSKDWANKTDGTIITHQGIDTGEYSSKKYAQEAKNSSNVTNTYKEEAKNYATNAQNSSTISQNQAKIATDSANSAKNSQTSAQNSANLAKTYADSALNDANSSKIYAEWSKQYANGKINQTHITNCITEIPQDIKLELNNGTLTLKAGSMIYKPKGFEADGVTKKFEKYVVKTDRQYTSPVTTETTLVFFITGSEGFTAISANVILSGSTIPKTGVIYNTNTNIVSFYRSGALEWTDGTLPFAIVKTSSTGELTSIEHIFNGFGYIGSTIYVLPGVKGLIPNGRNADGTLKNTEFVIDTVKIRTLSSNMSNRYWFLWKDNVSNFHYTTDYYISDTQPVSTAAASARWYNPKENKTYAYSTSQGKWTEYNYHIYLGFNNFTTDSSAKITSFTPKTTFKAVDDQEIVKTVGNQTIYNNKTFVADIYRNDVFDPNGTHTIVTRDTNNKGNTRISSYYASSGIYNRMQTNNNTSGKIAYIDIVARDDGTGVFQINGTSTISANLTNLSAIQVPTPAATDNSNRIASTAWVRNYVKNTGGGANWASKVSVARDVNYTAPSNGYIAAFIQFDDTTGTLTINNVQIFTTSGNVVSPSYTFIPVSKGDVVNIGGGAWRTAYFVPFK